MQVTDEMVLAAWEAYDNAPGCFTNSELMRAALTAALGAMWRPISEAPKDGTEILLFTHHDADPFCEDIFDAVQIGYWDDGNDAPGTVWHRDAGWILQKIGEPLAWQPLPSPPAQEG